MIRKTRRIIFYIFLIFFVILAYIAVLYSQGYTFDWQKKSLVMTGAFYFKSHPKEADIYIDNEYLGKTTKFIKRLIPQEYDIKISKPEYHDWQKTLGIESKLVTEAKDIILIKKNLLLNKITKNYNVRYFSFSNDKKKIVYLTDKTTNYSQLALRLIDLAGNTDEQIYPAPFFVKNDTGFTPLLPSLKNLLEISWSLNNERLLLSFSNNRYYILNLRDQSKIIDFNNLIRVLSNYKVYSIKNLSFHPQNSNKVYFYSKNNLYFTELNNSNLYESSIFSIIPDILTYKIHKNKILYIKYSDGGFYKTNLEASSFKKIFDIPFFPAQDWIIPGQEPDQDIEVFSDEILMVDNNLYLFNYQTQIFEKIATGVESIEFSNDDRKLLWNTKQEIGVIWLEPESRQSMREKYETEIVIKIFEEINQALWYSRTNQHIIFVVGDEIKITELDGRDRRNTMDIFSIKNSGVFYNEENAKLYVLSEEQLFEIDLD